MNKDKKETKPKVQEIKLSKVYKSTQNNENKLKNYIKDNGKRKLI
jgi:hypothetical protein